jgi:nucleoside-diphosphate-sugar epimerase
MKIAIFGSNGYIGKRLTRTLYNKDYKLVLFTRNIRSLEYTNTNNPFFIGVKPNICAVEQILSVAYFDEIVENLKGVDVAFYLIHSLSETKQDYRKKDNDLASLVAMAATKAGVKQIIYLGGFGNRNDKNVSRHLISRQETADYLRKYHNNVTEMRAGIIIGAGSMSFELIKSVAEVVPALSEIYNEGKTNITFIDDILEALVKVIDNKEYYNKIVEIGSLEALTYTQMVQIYAKEILHKNIRIIKLPKFISKLINNPSVLAFIMSRISGIETHMIKPLVESIYSDALIAKYRDTKLVPNPTDYKTAIKIAVKRMEDCEIECKWNVPYEYSVFNIFRVKQFSTALKQGNLFKEKVKRKILAEEVDRVFYNLKSLNYGNCGYFSPMWMWKTRAVIDRLLGGRGLGKRVVKPENIRVGDTFDFWVVTALKDTPSEKLIRFKSTMKMPGVGWLQGRIVKQDDEYIFALTAYFLPTSKVSFIYWYSFFFIHKYIFDEMCNNILNSECEKMKHQE